MREFLQELFGLRGKVALVTGGREGIGGAISLALASAGATVVIATRRPELATDLIDECRHLGTEAKAMLMDVTQPDSIQSTVDAVLQEFGVIDILVNNSGIALRGDSLHVSEQEWDQVLDTNLKGTFLVTQCVGKSMTAKHSGKVINITSTFGVVGYPERAAYAASKAGIIQLTKVLALEWAAHGITLNSVAPTTMTTASRAALFPSEEERKKRVEKIPLGRLGTPDDVVGAVIFFASSASDFVTGQTLLVDGGWTAQ